MATANLSSEALELWERSIAWLATVQETEPGPDRGGIRNPISGLCGARDAAHAALAFAYQWQCSGDAEWNNRAKDAFDFAIRHSRHHAFDEEIRIDNTGQWYVIPNSMFATGSAVESLRSTLEYGIDRQFPTDWAQSICENVMVLSFGDEGAIAHDSSYRAQLPPRDVQNTTLFGGFTLLSLGTLLSDGEERHRYLAAGTNSVAHGIEGQLEGGFWPYLYGGGSKDGDQTHQTYCLNTLAQIAESFPGRFDGVEEALEKGCAWFSRECVIRDPVTRIRWEWAEGLVVYGENHFDTCAYPNGAAALARCARLLRGHQDWTRTAVDLLHSIAVRLSITPPSDAGTILPLEVPADLRPSKSSSAAGDGWALRDMQRRITTEQFLPWKLAMFARTLRALNSQLEGHP